MELQELVAEAVRELKRRERAAKTIETYQWHWRGFLAFLANRGVTRPDQLTRELIHAWQDSLTQLTLGRPRTPAGRALAATAVRQLLRFGAEWECIDYRLTLAVARVKLHRRLPRPIPPDDFKRISAWFERRVRLGMARLTDY